MPVDPDVTPHMAWPFRIAGDGMLAVVDEGTLEEIRQNVLVLLHTPLGARPLAPDVGVEDPTFADTDPDVLAGDLMRFEPRAAVVVVVREGSWEGEREVSVSVEHGGS